MFLRNLEHRLHIWMISSQELAQTQIVRMPLLPDYVFLEEFDRYRALVSLQFGTYFRRTAGS